MVANISLFISTDTLESKRASPTSSSEKYHRWSPSVLLVVLKSRKSFRGASTPIGAVIQVLRWMITAKVARSRIPLFSEAVIWNWSRKSQILIACITLVIHLAQCMVPGTCKWKRHASNIAYIEELQGQQMHHLSLRMSPKPLALPYDGDMPRRANLFQASAL